MMIHPSAMVHESAVLGEGVEIGPFAVVGPRVKIGNGCRLAAHAIVHRDCELDEQVFVDNFVVIGGDAQMREARPESEQARVVVGARCVLREGVTIHRSAEQVGVTEVGPDGYLMSNSHVAHDCVVGEFATLANNAMLAGYVKLGAHTFVGGGAGVHQFVRVGQSAMIAGNAAISYDVPPFCVAVDRNDIIGLNRVGLRRRGFDREAMSDLKDCFRTVFRGSGNLRSDAQAALAAGACGSTAPGREFLEFFVAGGKRGFGQARKLRRGGDSEAGVASE
ncbi:MAG: acyl-ACP--UDP-N-acetylglucosamine O-acyltransferase [Planctomycetota bacterium]|nr:acyl-ACP--UDP-N-acetylglucosamine O-acyltransferase [Planctomycetota bacterium]